MGAVVKHESPTEQSNVLALIHRAATDPACDLDKMERLMAMHERMQERQARAEFADAMAAMQSELPAIGERGNAAGRYTFALWEDINTTIRPILQRHGFALTFRTDTQNNVTVTGVLTHRSGHREETSITLPADPSGNKNAVQAVASSVSYGKRYTSGALLNLTSHGEDDDAYRAVGEPEDLTDWRAKIADATTMAELQGVAGELAKSGVSAAGKKTLRALWAARAKAVAQ